jgi:thioredoxin 1
LNAKARPSLEGVSELRPGKRDGRKEIRWNLEFVIGIWGETMAGDNVQTFTDGNFDETVIKSGGPVLVDFWAEWCGPCKRIAPTIDALATEYDGKVMIGKLNVDENPDVVVKYQVRGIPTLLLFKGGQVVESVVGLAQKDYLKQVIDKHI